MVLIFFLRIYELAEIVYYDSITTLNSTIQASSAFCLLLLAILDGFTVYKEVSFFEKKFKEIENIFFFLQNNFYSYTCGMKFPIIAVKKNKSRKKSKRYTVYSPLTR